MTLVVDGRYETRAPSSGLVRLVDAAQNETGQGPCVHAAREHLTVRVDDLASDDRWPAFATRAVELGVRSMLSFQLFVEQTSFGALNLYSDRAGAFDEADEDVGLLLAAHAAVAFAAVSRQDNLRAALVTRDLIGQAKGILMERFKLSPDQAFHLLVLASQQRNCKLREIALELAETGELR